MSDEPNFIIRIRPSINSEFLYYYLNSYLYFDFLKSLQQTSTGLRNLPKREWLNFKIILPQPKERQKIAEILSTIDKAIQKTNEIIVKTERLKKGLMEELSKKGVNLFALEKEKILKCVKKCFKKKHHKFGREENLSHHLAEYLEKEFSNYNVDVEVEKTDRLRPDIIVHKRNTDQNLFAIEVKKDGSIEEIKEDIKKLEEIMLGKYKYCEAIFIGFNVRDFDSVLKLSDKVNLILVNPDGKIETKNRRREFKDTEIGRIPKERDVINLSKIMRFKNGERPKLTQGIFPVYGANGIMSYCSDFLVDNDFTLIVGHVGASGEIHLAKGKVWVSDNAIYSERYEIGKIYPPFAYYLLKFKKLAQFASKTTHPIITQNFLNTFKIQLPFLSEQQKIAEILSAVDKKLEIERKEKERLEKIKQGMMDLLLTGKIRIKVD